ncbi:sulfotransferase [Falsirhodobacter deserti]|uniref:sulfotransferase n=1 Tax=Falsirhodobacter deserti TaxID=1365611 RepID=UPI000FE31C26|nr:sulfotransferase [Falsirhodobacter deserti]
MTREPTILLGVGATKAGTTWLFDQLSRHPQCHLRGIKELHYFNTFVQGTWNRRLLALEQSAMRAPERMLADMADWAEILRLRRLSLRSYLGYLTKGRGDRPVVGDITPAYGLLPARILSRIQQLGDVRVLYLLRDPVDRLWSQVRMDARRAAGRDGDITQHLRDAFARALKGEGPAWLRSDYRGTLNRLDAAVAPGRLLVGFYETLMTAGGLGRVTDFLGIDRHTAQFDKRVHGGIDMPLNEEDRARAVQVLRPQYDYVARRMGDLPPRWQAAMAGV